MVSALQAEVAELRKHVDYLKNTDFSSLIQGVDGLDSPETLKKPSDSTRDIHIEEFVVNESDAEINEEKIEAQEASIFIDLSDLRDSWIGLGDIIVTKEIMMDDFFQVL